MRVGFLITHIRAEEKLLIEAFRAQGIEPDVILDRDLMFNINQGAEQLAPTGLAWADYDVIVERCVSTSRGMYALAVLNSWGVRTVNTFYTASICADKLQTSLALAQANIPQPEGGLLRTEWIGSDRRCELPCCLKTGDRLMGTFAGACE